MSVYSTDMTNSQVPKKTETERKRFYLSAFDKLSAIYFFNFEIYSSLNIIESSCYRNFYVGFYLFIIFIL